MTGAVEMAVRWPAEGRREHGRWRGVSGGDPDLGLSVSCVGAIGLGQTVYARGAP